MEIYVIERDNPNYRPEPEVMLDGNAALEIVKKEYKDQMNELDITWDMVYEDKCGYDCYWEFEYGSIEGTASIDDRDGDKWEWRITKHVI